MAQEQIQEDLKGKTKAKQRYLKEKKKRRKLRKSDGASVANKPKQSHQATPEAAESGLEEQELSSAAEEEKVNDLRNDSSERPQKRRRRDASEILEGEHKPEPAPSENAPLDDTPATLPSLPSFPLPSLPEAPSSASLALQGASSAVLSATHIYREDQLPISLDNPEDSSLLDLRTRTRLHELGITELFAVQTALVPFLLSPGPARSLYCPYAPPQDICVSAPTGSGKTLAYVLPIIEVLSTRVVTRLRALVVLPTRDLVVQVREIFEAVGKGRGLKVAAVTGSQSFAHEQSLLVADKSASLLGGSSKVDILICTPGRLIDHLNTTPNFSLQHLRYLVIDEADRLLAQSFQEWLPRVLSAIKHPLKHDTEHIPRLNDIGHADALSPTNTHILPHHPQLPFPTEKKDVSCQKLLFSATLTQDPGKLASLALRNPRYFVIHGERASSSQEDHVMDVVTEKFSMPASLSEHMIVSETSKKPLMFLYLVHARKITNALVFTKSAESTSRLLKLLDLFEELSIQKGTKSAQNRIIARAYSSDLGPGERKNILEQFKSQAIQILICSDLVSRGVDIKHVSHVVSYDTPVDMRKYVHRVGRTARAGREGDAWTLVEEQEARYFKAMLRKADHLTNVKRMRVSDDDVSTLTPLYNNALDQLREHSARR